MRCEKCRENIDSVYAYFNHLRREHGFWGSTLRLGSVTAIYHSIRRLMENVLWGLIFFFVVLLITVLFFEFRKNQPIVTQFDVPADFNGFTGVTIAELLIDRINDKISSVPSSAYSPVVGAAIGGGVQPDRAEPVRFKRATPEGLTIKMEVGGISLDSFVSYVKGIFGKENEVISGNVIKTGDVVKIIARTNKKGPWQEEGKIEDVETTVDKLAEEMAFDLASNYFEPDELAKFYTNHENYLSADRAFREIIKENPYNAEAYTDWARVLINMREYGDAICRYKKAVAIACPERSKEHSAAKKAGEQTEEEIRCPDPASTGSSVKSIFMFVKNQDQMACSDVLVQWGVGLSIMGDREGALQRYKEAAAEDPKNPKVYSELGYELYLRGRDEESKRNTDKAVLMYEESDKLFRQRSKLCDEFRTSAGFYRKSPGGLNELGKKCADFHNYWGLILGKLGEYEEGKQRNEEAKRRYLGAIREFEKVTEIDREYYWAYYNWGLYLYSLGRLNDSEYGRTGSRAEFEQATEKYFESAAKYRRALFINPRNVNAYNNLGLDLNVLGKYREAIEQYEKAIQIDSEYHLAYYNWGNSLQKLGNYEDSIEKYKKTISLNPSYVDAYINLGISYDALGRHEEAIEEYKKASEVAPDYHISYYNWGYTLQKLGSYGDSIEKFKKCISLNPGYVDAYVSAGIGYEALGKYKEAIYEYKKASEVNPDYHLPYFNWGYTLFEQCRRLSLSDKGCKKEEAIRKLLRFLDLSNGKYAELEKKAEGMIESLKSKQSGFVETPSEPNIDSKAPRQEVDLRAPERELNVNEKNSDQVPSTMEEPSQN